MVFSEPLEQKALVVDEKLHQCAVKDQGATYQTRTEEQPGV